MKLDINDKEKKYMEYSQLNSTINNPDYDDFHRCEYCCGNEKWTEFDALHNAMDIDDLKKTIKELRCELGAWISRADTIAKDKHEIHNELITCNSTTIPQLKAKIKEYEKNSINNKKDKE